MDAVAHILFVEWDNVNWHALKEALESQGYQVDCALNEQEALQRLQHGEPPQLILVDITPAAKGALELIRGLRQDPRHTSVPIVVFGTQSDSSYPVTLMDVDGLLKKPVEFDELLATVHQFSARSSPGKPAPQGRPGIDSPRTTPHARFQGPAGRPGCKVLIVEDNFDGAESLRMLLKLLGHEVRVAYNGVQGVKIAQEWKPDIVLCDIGLPDLDGYEVAGELRRDRQTAQARLIAVTAYGTEEDKRRAKESGFDLFMTKPADPDELLRLVTCPNRLSPTN